MVSTCSLLQMSVVFPSRAIDWSPVQARGLRPGKALFLTGHGMRVACGDRHDSTYVSIGLCAAKRVTLQFSLGRGGPHHSLGSCLLKPQDVLIGSTRSVSSARDDIVLGSVEGSFEPIRSVRASATAALMTLNSTQSSVDSPAGDRNVLFGRLQD